MVQQGDFMVQLVDAETKEPFKEHVKDGKVYVEAEPDVEYFISMQKIGKKHQGYSLIYCSVDGQDFEWQHQYEASSVTSPYYGGMWQYEDAVSSEKALRFVKPRLSRTNDTPPLLMGKVELKIYHGIFDGYGERTSYNKSLVPATVGLDQGGAGRKSLRSGEGTTVQSKACSKKVMEIRTGKHMDTITLNYCSAVGLIEAGVLPKPDLWDYHRTKRPARPPSSDVPQIEPQKICKYPGVSDETVDLFDFSQITSDESDYED